MPPHVVLSEGYWPGMGAEVQQATYVDGAIIVGAGPAGLATAASLKEQGVSSLILEKASCIASLWQNKTYDRLHLHLPKQFCELPLLPFPASYPTYPAKNQFISYLQEYTDHFGIQPLFHHSVSLAYFEPRTQLWHVHATTWKPDSNFCSTKEFRSRWLVVASGENAEPVAPSFRGAADFRGNVFHASCYKNGAQYQNKKVLVVGCGNTGMEIALDLANFGADPSIVVRNPTHILPREIFGKSTFLVAMMAMKTWIPLWLTDYFLVKYTDVTLGDTTRVGIPRPEEGPMTMKEKYGKTPVLDVGTLAVIKSGQVKVRPAIECLTQTGARFDDGRCEDFDAVILATGYKSNVPKWLQDDGKFFSEEGFPKMPFPHGWKGSAGLYVAGLGRKGILGASIDASRIAIDIATEYNTDISSLSRVVPCRSHQSIYNIPCPGGDAQTQI